MKIPYVHSNYPRIPGDDYKTIDKRCIYGLLEHFSISGICLDVCSPGGSGIVLALKEQGISARGTNDAFEESIKADWIVTNPPYTRGLVDKIIWRQIGRVIKKEVHVFACLLRSNFDFAVSRTDMFMNCPYYLGQIKLLFRPWWSDDRKAQPIHNYVWHIWDNVIPHADKIVLYSFGKEA